MSRVDIAEDICFEGCIDGDDAKSAHYLWMIRQFVRAQDDMLLVELDIVHHPVIDLIAQSQTT